MAAITIESLEFTNADVMVSSVSDKLIKIHNEANAFDISDSLHDVVGLAMDVGAVKILIQYAKMNVVTPLQANNVYKAFMYKHRLDIETVVNWDFDE